VIFACYRPILRDDRISIENTIKSTVIVANNSILVLMFSYIMGLLWYRLSDYLFPLWFPYEPSSAYFVQRFDLRRPPGCERVFGQAVTLSGKTIRCIYFMLTTLSTVGYGDFYPSSMAEKLLGILIQFGGVTIFSIVMTSFTEVFDFQKRDQKYEKLQVWLTVIKRIRLQPFGEGTDIPPAVKYELEQHFNYFWANDRVASLLANRDYFDSIPFNIQNHIMTEFLFEDIFGKSAFKVFFQSGKEFDANFMFEVAFGFMPREF